MASASRRGTSCPPLPPPASRALTLPPTRVTKSQWLRWSWCLGSRTGSLFLVVKAAEPNSSLQFLETLHNFFIASATHSWRRGFFCNGQHHGKGSSTSGDLECYQQPLKMVFAEVRTAFFNRKLWMSLPRKVMIFALDGFPKFSMIIFVQKSDTKCSLQ